MCFLIYFIFSFLRPFCVLLQNFHEVAYFADDRQDLLNGINEFLDCSIVIPPSDIEGKDLLKTVADFQKQLLRKRKEREGKKCQPVSAVEQDNKGMSSKSTAPKLPSLTFIIWLSLIFFCFNLSEASPEEEEQGEQEVDPLKRSGIPFGGLIHDIRRRYPQYVSDLKDALDMQCVAAVIFIYFAALSPTITFGGLLGKPELLTPGKLQKH